jgi:hypothetical protein
MPHHLSPDCQDLIRSMIEINPERRIKVIPIYFFRFSNNIAYIKLKIEEINRHPWVMA